MGGVAAGLAPRRRQPGAGGVVDDPQVETVPIDHQRRRARLLREADLARRRHDAEPAAHPGGEVHPVDVGQTELIDVGVHRGHHEVPGQHRPVVPALVAPEAAVQVGPMQRATRPSPRRRVEGGAVGDAQIDRFGQLTFVGGHAPFYPGPPRASRGRGVLAVPRSIEAPVRSGLRGGHEVRYQRVPTTRVGVAPGSPLAPSRSHPVCTMCSRVVPSPRSSNVNSTSVASVRSLRCARGMRGDAAGPNR